MVTLKDFSARELAIAENLIKDRATDLQEQINKTIEFFTQAGAEVPDQSWRIEQVDILARLAVIIHEQAIEAAMQKIIQSN